MWSFRDPLPPETVHFDGACAAEGEFLCWSWNEFFAWSPRGGWLALPALDGSPMFVRRAGGGVLVFTGTGELADHRVSFWRPGTPDWAWHGKVPRLDGFPDSPYASAHVATAGTILAVCDRRTRGNPIRAFRMDETRLVPLGLVYGDVSDRSFFAGGCTDEDGSLLALSHARAFRLRVDGGRLVLDTLWAVTPPHLSPELPPVVVSDLVLFPVKGHSPPRVFDLRTGEISNPGLPTVEGAEVLWTTWAAGDAARTVRLLDDLQATPRPVPEARPLAVLFGEGGVLAVATTRGIGHRRPFAGNDEAPSRVPGSLFSAEGLRHWRCALDPFERLGTHFLSHVRDASSDPDARATLSRNGAALARRILERVVAREDDPSAPLPEADREALSRFDRGPDAIAASAEIRRDLASCDPARLTAALRVASSMTFGIARFFRPGSDPGPSVLGRGLGSNSSRVVLAALHVLGPSHWGKPDFAEELRAALTSADPHVRSGALAGLDRSDCGREPVRTAVHERLRCDPVDEVRRIALERIDLSPGGKAADDLVAAIADPSAAVRAAAIRAISRLRGDEWEQALPDAFDRVLLAILSGLEPRDSTGDRSSVVELLRPGLPAEELPENEYDDEPYLAGDLEATLYRLFAAEGLGLPIEDAERELAVRFALEDEGDSVCGGRLTGCHIESLRRPTASRDTLASALAIARRNPTIGRRCVLLACVGIARAAPDGSRPERPQEGRHGGGALHERLRTAGRDASEGLAMDLLRREARGDDSFALLALWFLASRGEPGAFGALRQRLPEACGTWPTLVVAWASLAPDEATKRAGLRDVLLSPLVSAPVRLQLQAGLLPDPLADGLGAELLPFFRAVAADASIPFNERREAALRARDAGDSAVIVELWNGLATRPPGDFPDAEREGDLA